MTEATGRQPHAWLILGERAGDNAQVLALGRSLAESLGWSCQSKRIHYDSACRVPFEKRGASLAGVDLAKTDPLSEPWPDVLVAIGRRSVPVARWIKSQARKRIFHVHLGRPRAKFELFDLVVTTPQYDLPAAPNVMKISLPFVRIEEQALAGAASDWRQRLQSMPRPWTAVLVGGPTPQLSFGVAEGRRLLAELLAYQSASGGSLLVTTSPRTDANVVDVLRDELTGPHVFCPYGQEAENPYLGFLALADRFIISIDSANMIAEAATRAKPLFLFQLPRLTTGRRRGPIAAIGRRWRKNRKARRDAGRKPNLLDRLHDLWTVKGKARPRRDIDLLEKAVYELGLARPLAEAGAHDFAPDAEKLERERRAVIDRIRSLYAALGTQAPPT